MSTEYEIARRVAARVAAVKLRSLLVADAYLSLRQRDELLDLVANLISRPREAQEFRRRMVKLLDGRFGRNPDTFEVSDSTAEALRLLDAL